MGLRMCANQHAVGLRHFLLIHSGTHFFKAAAVNHRDGFRAQFLDLHRDIDGRIAATDDNHIPTDGQGREFFLAYQFDEINGIVNTINILKVEMAKESPDTWKRVKEALLTQEGDEIDISGLLEQEGSA